MGTRLSRYRLRCAVHEQCAGSGPGHRCDPVVLARSCRANPTTWTQCSTSVSHRSRRQDTSSSSYVCKFCLSSGCFELSHGGCSWRLSDLGYQTLVDRRPRARSRGLPARDVGETMEFYPDARGIRSWMVSAYHPDTHALYIPIHQTCTKGVFSEVERKEHDPGLLVLLRRTRRILGGNPLAADFCIPRPRPGGLTDRNGHHQQRDSLE